MGKLPKGSFKGKNEYVIDHCPGEGCYQKLWWNPTKGVGHCFRCGFRLNKFTFKKHFGVFGGLSDFLDMSPIDNSSDWKLKRKVDLVNALRGDQYAWDYPTARVFLKSKGITEDLAFRVPIKWSVEHSAMVLPIDSVYGKTRDSILWRSPTGWPNKWISPGGSTKEYVFGARHIRTENRGVVLCEGAHDVLATGLLGKGIALLGSDISEDKAAFVGNNWNLAMIWMDPDYAGKKGEKLISRKLRDWAQQCKVEVIRTPQDPKNYRMHSAEVIKIGMRISELGKRNRCTLKSSC